MKISITMLILFFSNFIIAQQTVTWIGGTPGHETNWNEEKNWSTRHVPDENSIVVIKWTNSGHHSQPIIKGKATAASIAIHAQATLSIESEGDLVLDGNYTLSDGINFYNGQLINNGAIKFLDIDRVLTAEYLENFQNSGEIIKGTSAQNLLTKIIVGGSK